MGVPMPHDQPYHEAENKTKTVIEGLEDYLDWSRTNQGNLSIKKIITMIEGLQDCPDWESRKSRQSIMGIKQIKKITVKTKGGNHAQ